MGSEKDWMDDLVTVTLTRKEWEAVRRAATDSVRVSTRSCYWMDAAQVKRCQTILTMASMGSEQSEWPIRQVGDRYEEIKP